VRARVKKVGGPEDEVAEVDEPVLGEQPVVGRVERGELALALGPVLAVRERRGPGAIGGMVDAGLLEPVDPREDRAQRRGGPAAEVVLAQREVADALEQEREPVGGRGRDRERVEPGLERLVAQQPRAHRMDRQDRELLERPVAERLLDAGPERVGGARGPRDQEQRLGRRALRDEVGEARDERPRASAARSAEDEQRPAAVGGRARLVGREGAGRIGHDPRICPP